MPVVTTLKYDKAELDKLVLSKPAVEAADWILPERRRITGEGVWLQQAGFLTRDDLARIVEAQPRAEGQTATVVMLGPKGMKVELTPKPEPAEEA